MLPSWDLKVVKKYALDAIEMLQKRRRKFNSFNLLSLNQKFNKRKLKHQKLNLVKNRLSLNKKKSRILSHRQKKRMRNQANLKTDQIFPSLIESKKNHSYPYRKNLKKQLEAVTFKRCKILWNWYTRSKTNSNDDANLCYINLLIILFRINVQ